MPTADAAAVEHALVIYTRPKSLISILIQNSARVHSLQVVPQTPIHAAGESSSANGTRSLECIASLTMRANVPARLSTTVRYSSSALEMQADLRPQPELLNKVEFGPTH
jgi:hypothetical protein